MVFKSPNKAQIMLVKCENNASDSKGDMSIRLIPPVQCHGSDAAAAQGAART